MWRDTATTRPTTLLALLALLALMLALTGCGGGEEEDEGAAAADLSTEVEPIEIDFENVLLANIDWPDGIQLNSDDDDFEWPEGADNYDQLYDLVKAPKDVTDAARDTFDDMLARYTEYSQAEFDAGREPAKFADWLLSSDSIPPLGLTPGLQGTWTVDAPHPGWRPPITVDRPNAPKAPTRFRCKRIWIFPFCWGY